MLCPHLPQLQSPKYSPAPLAGLRCRPLQAKGKADGRIERVHASAKRAREPMLSHKTLVTLQGSRVEQSPTPTMGRESACVIISVIL